MNACVVFTLTAGNATTEMQAARAAPMSEAVPVAFAGSINAYCTHAKLAKAALKTMRSKQAEVWIVWC